MNFRHNTFREERPRLFLIDLEKIRTDAAVNIDYRITQSILAEQIKQILLNRYPQLVTANTFNGDDKYLYFDALNYKLGSSPIAPQDHINENVIRMLDEYHWIFISTIPNLIEVINGG